MSKYYSRRICTHEDCKEFSITNHRTQKEMREYESTKRKWTCNRHSYPEEVLSIDVNSTIQVLTVESNEYGQYWRISGAKKLSSGFQFGNGYKAWADDFPIGTKLKVTAEIITPKIQE